MKTKTRTVTAFWAIQDENGYLVKASGKGEQNAFLMFTAKSDAETCAVQIRVRGINATPVRLF